ncbi:MAG: NYN domain-containing protein [Roseovarius sp.]
MILFLLSVAGCAAAWAVPGWRDAMLVAGPCAIGSLWLLLRGYLERRRATGRNRVVLDGSNVMHWKAGTPQLATVREVVDRLTAEGFAPGVVFDANVGYKVGDRYLGDRALAALMGLPRNRIMVVPRGQPADPTILTAARDMKAPIVSNDRFRDWEDAFPEARDGGRLIRGGYKRGRLWLDLPDRD